MTLHIFSHSALDGPVSSSDSLHVVSFAGSLRDGSYNRALLRNAKDLAPDGMTIEMLDVGDIPLYDADVEEQGDPPDVAMNAAGDENTGVASGINNAASRLAGLLAIVVLGSVAVGLFSAALQHHLATIEAPAGLKEQVWAVRHDLVGLTVPADADPATRERLVAAVNRSYVWSFR